MVAYKPSTVSHMKLVPTYLIHTKYVHTSEYNYMTHVKIPSFLGANRLPQNCLLHSPTPLKAARESPDSRK